MPHTLLLADDSVTIQRVIELTFADEDIRVVAVSDGRQAIEQAQAAPPDIVLADIGMPELDGYEVAAFIKGTPALAHIPVLLLTGAFEPIDEGRARAVGCDGVLVKPFEPQMVINRVKNLIRGRRAAPPPGAAGTGSSAPIAVPRGDRPHAAASERPSTDDYLDRLDAAFAQRDATGVPAGAAQTDPDAFILPVEENVADRLADELAQWTPPPAPPPPAVHEAPPPPAAVSAVASGEPATARPAASLADAFAALLAAEQGRALEAPAAQRLATSDTFLDHVTRLVIERLADRAMRDVVLDVAERVVREEIERIKAQSR